MLTLGPPEPGRGAPAASPAIVHPPWVTDAPLPPVPAEAADLDGDDDDDEHGTHEIPPELLNEQVVCAQYMMVGYDNRKAWKRRWVVLRGTRLALYKNDKEYLLHSVVHATDLRAVALVNPKRHGAAICLVTPSRTMYLSMPDTARVHYWLDALERVRRQAAEPAAPSPTSPVAIAPGSVRAGGERSRMDAAPALAVPTSTSPPAGTSSSWTARSLMRAPPIITVPRQRSHDVLRAPPPWPGAGAAPAALSSSEDEMDDAGDSPAPPLASAPQDAGDRMIVQGYLLKQSNRRKQWNKRWFVLTFDYLCYSHHPLEARTRRRVPTRAILDAMDYDVPNANAYAPGLSLSPLSPTSFGLRSFGAASTHADKPTHAERSGPPDTTQHGFELLNHRPMHTFRVVTADRSFVLGAPTEEDEIHWLSALQTLLQRQRAAGASTAPPAPTTSAAVP